MGQAQLVRGSVVCGALRMPEKGGEAVIQCRGDCELEGGRAGLGRVPMPMPGR